MKLSLLRRILAALVFVLSLFFFLDFSGILHLSLHRLFHLQWVPALMSASIGILVILLLLSLFFGRIYCSVLCPLGIFQDLVSRIARSKIGRKSGKKRKYFHYLQERIWLRNSLLAVFIFSLLFGWAAVVTLLDPYSIFGRMAAQIFHPLYLWMNNGLAYVGNRMGYFALYDVQIILAGTFTLCVTGLSLLLVVYLAFKWGRLYCNTICPVGTFLGWISRISLMRIRFDHERCNACGNCERVCKSSCIDSKSQKIDQSRCVSCYNCLDHCKHNALHYGWFVRRKSENPEQHTDTSRRRFFTTAGMVSLSIPMAKASVFLNKSTRRKTPVAPPGAQSHAHLLKHCTACHLCVAKCPSQIIRPASFEYGIEGIMQPVLNFEKGFCTFDCTVCSQVCPNGALMPLNKEQKHQLQTGRVKLDLERCVVKTDHTNCGACSEHCPTQAVEMIPYTGALTIPQIHPEICVGCGGCEYICPVLPQTAIYVEGLSIHQKAQEIVKEQKKEVSIDDFGF